MGGWLAEDCTLELGNRNVIAGSVSSFLLLVTALTMGWRYCVLVGVVAVGGYETDAV